MERTNVHLEETSLSRSPVVGMTLSADALLVDRILRGDAEAGRHFVRDHYVAVYRYLLYLTGSPDSAEDLTQETFVQAWRGLGSLDARILLRPWLHRIAHREFLQALRQQRPLTSLEDIADIAAPGGAAVAEAVELRAAIRELPVTEREMVVLHYLEGYNCEEIAEIVGVPAGTVKYRLSEARARLRRVFGDVEQDDPRRAKP
jgi:RNA polymerase sigma-70 factor (ECF subfamily)